MTSNHVLGMTVALPDGEVVELGGESLEGVGPDLPGFFVGSEGLFGVALEITLRLLPIPQTYRTVAGGVRVVACGGGCGDGGGCFRAAAGCNRNHGTRWLSRLLR